LCRCDVQRRRTCGNHSGLIVKTIPGQREKPFAFPPESPFTFSPESCSPLPRNAFHVHPGIAFTLPRNPHYITVYATPDRKRTPEPTPQAQ